MKKISFYVILFGLNISLIACSHNMVDDSIDTDSEYLLFIDNNKFANELQYIKESQIYKTHKLFKRSFC